MPNTDLVAINPEKRGKLKSETLFLFKQYEVGYYHHWLNKGLKFYPLANKVLTCAFVEDHFETDYEYLIFLDTDTAVLQGFSEVFDNNFEIAAKPDDDVNNVNWIDGQPPNSFWKLIADNTGLHDTDIWSMQNQINPERFKAFFNSGVIIKKTGNKFFNRWLENFRQIMTDKRLFQIDYLHFFFLEQASFGFTALKEFSKSDILLLDYKYNYPVHLHERVRDTGSPYILHYHDEFFQDKFNISWLSDFNIPEELRGLLPLNPKRNSPLKRLRKIFSFQQHKLKYRF